MTRFLLVLLMLALDPSAARALAAAQSARPGPRFDPEESLLVATMIRREQLPEARSLRIIQLLHADAAGAPQGLTRTPEEARALATTLRRRALAGESMGALARTYSAAPNAALGGVLGTHARGILAPQLDEFLFSAEVGQISEPIALPTGVFLAERVERWAAARTIMVRGTDQAAVERMDGIVARLGAGEDFAALAGQLSEDPVTAPRGGALAIFERGPEDRLLKAAAFDLQVGQVSAPIESPLGLHLVERVELDALPDSLREQNFVRASAIVLIQSDTALPIPSGDRNAPETAALARELHRRLLEGEDFEQLAREFNEDFGDGKQRAGDLGWLHFRQPGLSPSLRRIFEVPPGELLEPMPTNFGWMLLKRTG
jgi:parvulin-like peptidyl-prolyl isomerase